MGKYPFVKQHDEKDCGAATVAMLCQYWGLKLPLADVRTQVRTDINGTTMYGLVEGLTNYGFVADGASGTVDDLINAVNNKEIAVPFIARIIKDNILEHFVVVYKLDKCSVTIGDPAIGIMKLKLNTFASLWTGHVVHAKIGDNFAPADYTKGKLSKYLHLVFKQKKILVLSLVMSLVISIITVAGSMAFYTVVEVLSDTGNSEHVHEEVNEDAEEVDKENFIAVWETDLIEWLEQQPVVQALDELIMNIDLVFFVIIAMYLFRLFINIFRGKMLAILSKNVECSILFESYEKLLNLPMHFFESRSTGEIMSRFDDIAEICNAVSGGSLTLILDTLMALLTGCVLICLSKSLTAWSLVIIALYVFVILFFKKPIARISQSVMGQHAIITSLFKQTVDGIIVIKSHSDKKEKCHSVCEEYEEYTQIKVRASILETVQNSIVTFVAVSGLILILWKGSSMCAQGVLSLSILITYYNILNYFLTSVTDLISLQSDIQTAVVSAERLNDILDCAGEGGQESDISFIPGDIEFNNVAFRYGGGPRLFDSLNLQIRAGEKVAIIGESGCGKSTIAKLLSAFYTTESGEITLGQIPLSRYSMDTLRKHIVYVSGNGVMFEDSIYNNIVLHNKAVSLDTVRKICARLQIDDFIQSLPYGYDTLVDDNGSIFSTGQRQRINIARALIHQPDILILDEATSNLDPISERQINNVINELRGKTTCIVIAHKLSTIKDCDHIILLENGKIMCEGTHDWLMHNSPTYMNY
ncbi:MAG: peptidase domain-containing ABC transporter [Lachnospiraceae bacterium]|nr:peptidase domain-containing ABC transporter [Lachnospiraceae bacterium]